jgi:hypothetical protein
LKDTKKEEKEKGKKDRKRARIRSEDEKYRVFSFIPAMVNVNTAILSL